MTLTPLCVIVVLILAACGVGWVLALIAKFFVTLRWKYHMKKLVKEGEALFDRANEASKKNALPSQGERAKR